MVTFHCLHCKRSFQVKRNPNQQYCGDKRCQAIRKRRWRRDKRETDPAYRENQQYSQQHWLSRRTDYWRDYRDSHSIYRERNREQSKKRQRLRRQRLQMEFAKSDALTQEKSVKSGCYYLVMVNEENASMFAKSPPYRQDFFIVINYPDETLEPTDI